MTVSVNTPPSVSATSTSAIICEGETINLMATGAATYIWSGPNNFSSTAQNPTIPNATIAAAGTYTVTGTDANDCTMTASTTIMVTPLPTISIVDGNDPMCTTDMTNIVVNGSNAASYTWSLSTLPTNVSASNTSGSGVIGTSINETITNNSGVPVLVLSLIHI